MPQPASVKEFERALRKLGKPRGKQPAFLRAHAKAKGRALNMRSIAKYAGYKNYRAGNLQYGLLADRLGHEMGRQKEGFGLLVEFVKPKVISNGEWLLIMRPNFAKALSRAGWI